MRKVVHKTCSQHLLVYIVSGATPHGNVPTQHISIEIHQIPQGDVRVTVLHMCPWLLQRAHNFHRNQVLKSALSVVPLYTRGEVCVCVFTT